MNKKLVNKVIKKVKYMQDNNLVYVTCGKCYNPYAIKKRWSNKINCEDCNQINEVKGNVRGE